MSAEDSTSSQADLSLRMLLHLQATTESLASAPFSSRERIVLAAVELFATNGYRATSMRQIAAKADMRAASIYNHFANKDQLVAEAIHRVLDDFIAYITEALTPSHGPAEALKGLVRRHVLYELRYPGRLDAWRLVIESDRLGRFLPENARRTMEERRTLLIDLQAALATTVFPHVDQPRDRVRIIGTICGRVGWWADIENRNGDELADFVWSLALDVLQGSSQCPPELA